MKRIVIVVMITVIVSLTLGAQLALAGGPPGSLIIQPGSGQKPLWDVAGTDGVPPPEITIVLPNGKIIQPRDSGGVNEGGEGGGGGII